MPNITLKKAKSSSVKADVVVLGVQPRDGELRVAPGAEAVDHALGGRLPQTLALLGASGRANEVTLVPSGGALNAPMIAAVGLGAGPGKARHGREDGGTPTTEDLRRAAGAAIRRLNARPDAGTTVAYALPTPDPDTLRAVAEGVVLGDYAFDRYRTSANGTKETATDVVLLTDHARDKATKDALSRAIAVAEAVNLARDWVNTAPADLHPAEFANLAKAAAKGHGVHIEVWDERALAKDGYGGILGVGQGSTQPPRLLKLSYRHGKATDHLVYVGKGITFDTGGLSLKPAASMMSMKSDMSGAAAVLAAIIAIARLRLPVDVTVWAALAENMPSGSATRPSDVLTIYGGKTVEVLNTDAEGRLVLADALVRASEDKPDLIVDVATLTGACVVALGHRVFGILGDDDARERIHEVAADVGELGWPLPIPEEIREGLKSKVADIANVSSDRAGGTLVGAAFLRDFVGDNVPWVHLDIAGPAFNEKSAWGYTPEGGTGVAVRTLVGLAEQSATR